MRLIDQLKAAQGDLELQRSIIMNFKFKPSPPPVPNGDWVNDDSILTFDAEGTQIELDAAYSCGYIPIEFTMLRGAQ